MVSSTVRSILTSRITEVKSNVACNENDEENDTKTSADPNPQKPQSNYYVNKTDVDPFPSPSLTDLPGQDQKASVRVAVDEVLADALAQEAAKACFDDLRKIVMVKLGVFWTDFSQSSASLPPLRLELKPDAKHVQVKVRKYSDSQWNCTRKIGGRLLEDGLVYPIPTALALHLPLSLTETEVERSSAAKIFCKFDMIYGYLQLLLHEYSQECQSFLAPDGIITPTRSLHRSWNANAALMSKMDSDLKENLLILVNDLAIAVKDTDDLLKYTTKVLDFCVGVNFKQNVPNVVF